MGSNITEFAFSFMQNLPHQPDAPAGKHRRGIFSTGENIHYRSDQLGDLVGERSYLGFIDTVTGNLSARIKQFVTRVHQQQWQQ